MKNLIYYILFVYAIICALTICFFDGTGDSGDSITHYLFARYAPAHVAFYFDHWAKPVFVLLASPFAQFGFKGMKLFNCLISLATIFITYKTALLLNVRNAILIAVIMIFSPLYYILTFSGLTEPLFALFTVSGIYLCLKQKYVNASILISFLPYVRSEGLIIAGVFGIYLLYKNLWKLLPFLFVGSVVYGIAGYFIYHDFLWVFTRIPYAKLSSVYGSGGLFHFVEEMINVVGVPMYVLFWVGIILMTVRFAKKQIQSEESILILGGFICFFVAHSLFWYLGIFNSMGLKRVLLGILPFMAYIVLQGFNYLTEDLLKSKRRFKLTVQALLLLYICIFPFTPNPSAIQWKKDMCMSEDLLLSFKAVNALPLEKEKNYPLFFNHHCLSFALNLDYFDEKKCRKISKENIVLMKPGSVLIWDNRYAEVESGIKKHELDNMPELQNLFTYTVKDGGRDMIFSAYSKK